MSVSVCTWQSRVKSLVFGDVVPLPRGVVAVATSSAMVSRAPRCHGERVPGAQLECLFGLKRDGEAA